MFGRGRLNGDVERPPLAGRDRLDHLVGEPQGPPGERAGRLPLGRRFDADDEPVAGALVTAAGPMKLGANSLSRGLGPLVADTAGRVHVSQIDPAVQYALLVTAPRFRGDVAIAWLANPPMNAISPDVIGDLGKVWEEVKSDGEIKAMVIYSSMPVVYSAGADIKAFTKMDESSGRKLLDDMHALLRRMEQSRTVTIAAVNALAREDEI